MVNVKQLLSKAESTLIGTSENELLKDVQGRMYRTDTLCEENETLLHRDVESILSHSGVPATKISISILQLATMLPYDWWFEYSVVSIGAGAWLYVYTNGAEEKPSRNLLGTMYHFSAEKSMMFKLGVDDELVDYDIFRRNTRSDSSVMRKDLVAKFDGRRTRGLCESEKEYARGLVSSLNLSVDEAIKYAVDIPRQWLKLYNINTVAQAAWLMYFVRKTGYLSDDILSKLHLDRIDLKPEGKYDRFIQLCVEHNLSMNIGPFDDDNDIMYDKMCEVQNYAFLKYGDKGFLGYGLVLRDALDYRFEWESKSAVDIMYQYIAIADADRSGQAISKDMYTKMHKDFYSRRDVFRLCGFLKNSLGVSEDDIKKSLIEAANNKII